MGQSVVPATELQAQCLAMLDDVESNRATFVVTRHGRPVAKLVPLESSRTTMGSVTLVSDDEQDHFSTGETWDAG